jgi:serine/threonine protein kinase
MNLVMRVEEKPFDLAINTHNEWLVGSVESLLLGRVLLPSVVPAIGHSLPAVPVASDEEVQTFLKRYFHSFPEHETSSIRLLNNGRALKYGRKVHLHEALALQFIREYTSIPVPTVHLAFEVRGITFIVMENMAGENLDSLLEKDSIDDAQLGCIAKELVEYMQQIQKLVPPSDPDGRLFGSFPSGPYNNVYFDPPPPRRYKYIEELSMYLVSMTATNPVSPPLLRVGQQVPTILAHGDLNPSNIMVKDGRISGIIDWDTFGSYPPWWEYMRVVRPWTRWDPIIKIEMDAAMNDGRIIHWDPSDDLVGAYYKSVALILLKQDMGHFGGG